MGRTPRGEERPGCPRVGLGGIQAGLVEKAAGGASPEGARQAPRAAHHPGLPSIPRACPSLTPACGWPPVCVSELSGGQLVYELRAGFKRKGHFWECGRAGGGQGPRQWREGGGPAGASSPACPDHSGPATRGEPRKAVGSRRAREAGREACPADRAPGVLRQWLLGPGLKPPKPPGCRHTHPGPGSAPSWLRPLLAAAPTPACALIAVCVAGSCFSTSLDPRIPAASPRSGAWPADPGAGPASPSPSWASPSPLWLWPMGWAARGLQGRAWVPPTCRHPDAAELPTLRLG